MNQPVIAGKMKLKRLTVLVVTLAAAFSRSVLDHAAGIARANHELSNVAMVMVSGGDPKVATVKRGILMRWR